MVGSYHKVLIRVVYCTFRDFLHLTVSLIFMHKNCIIVLCALVEWTFMLAS